jgi:hypothetical protein
MSAPLLAEFETPERLIEAARRIARAGHRPLDALTPFALPALAEVFPSERSHIRWAMLIAGSAMAAVAYSIQWFSAVVDYPLDVGGRALNSWPVFLLVPFEVALLAAAVAGFATLLRESGLPRLHDAVFAVRDVERASQDRFFLLAQPKEAAEPNELRHSLEQLGAVSVSTVPP